MKTLSTATLFLLSSRRHKSPYYVHCLTTSTHTHVIHHHAPAPAPAATFVPKGDSLEFHQSRNDFHRRFISMTDSTLEDIDNTSQQPNVESFDEEPTSVRTTSGTTLTSTSTYLSSLSSSSIITTETTTAPESTHPTTTTIITDPVQNSNQQQHHQQHYHTTPPPPSPPITITPKPPTLPQIIRFAIPAIGIWLCSPLLSLIDTSTVGLLSGTAQQAALNPAVAITDYGCLLVGFMYTATTNLVASARATTAASEPTTGDSDESTARGVLTDALQLSTTIGITLGTLLAVTAPTLLLFLTGSTVSTHSPQHSTAVSSAAIRYIKIRACGMPAAVAIGSAQSACLGMRDVRSPLYVLVVAAVVNLMGDLVLVGRRGRWVGGVAGAAWATVLSQYVALGLFVGWLTTGGGGGRRGDASSSSGHSHKENDDNESKETPFSARGFLKGRFSPRQLLTLPSRKSIRLFQPYFLPVTTTLVGRVSCYVTMSHVVSSTLGSTAMAANQIVLSFFYCLCPIADSLCLAAQSFVPGICEGGGGGGGGDDGEGRKRVRAETMRDTVRSFGGAALVAGIIMAGVGGFMPRLGGFFSSDRTVLAEVMKAVPALVGSMSLHGFICAGEGILLGQKDLGFLGRAYACFFVLVPYLMLRVKKAALSSGSAAVGLNSVWTVFLAYQVARATLWIVRLAQLQRRLDVSVSKSG